VLGFAASLPEMPIRFLVEIGPTIVMSFLEDELSVTVRKRLGGEFSVTQTNVALWHRRRAIPNPENL
jgi:predicted Rdx family selenoprotein